MTRIHNNQETRKGVGFRFEDFIFLANHTNNIAPLLEALIFSDVLLNLVSIKAIPERLAVAASESISQFAALVEHHFQRAPTDLVIVLAVSGIMHGSKLALVKRAAHFVIDNLAGPSDRLSYIHQLPASICPRNRGTWDEGQQQTFPVHAFGFGSDHNPLAMHAISDASGGTFSFIESYEVVQDAFASCIGGLLSVATQDLCLMVRAAKHGVEIKSIPSGRYDGSISNGGFQGMLNVGNLYPDEEKEFLINLSEDITCSYKDVVSKEIVQIECELVELQRPKLVSPQDMIVNLEVDRQGNRLNAAESIA
ncbi:hypothetical protein Pfo_027205 [Paulownia fortunei]|nr:hypothetical protein Pfo_027205 [Paulownia fortunei]